VFAENDGSGLAADAPPPSADSVRTDRAFAALHREHALGIYNLALHLLRQRQDAEDVTQEVLLKIFLHGRRGDASATPPWVYRVTYNACCDRLRREGRRRTTTLEFGDELIATGDPYQQAELARLIEAALRQLPLRQRTALLLRELQGLRPHEVATVLGSTTPSAGVTLSRARRTFRARFRELAGEEPAAAVGPGALSLVALPAGLHLAALRGALTTLGGTSGAAAAGPGASVASSLGATTCGPAGGTATLGGSGLTPQAGVGVLSKIGGALSTKVAVAVASATLVAGGASQVLRSHDRHTPRQTTAGRALQPATAAHGEAAKTQRAAGAEVTLQPLPRARISASPTLGSAPVAAASTTPTPSATTAPPVITGQSTSPQPSASPSLSPSATPSPSASSSPAPSPSPTASLSPAPSAVPSPTASVTASPSPTASAAPTAKTAFRVAPLPAVLRDRLGSSSQALSSTSPAFLPVTITYGTQAVGASASYPASYDLRSLGKLPAMDDVGAHNACWAFAALDSLDSCLLPADPESFSTDNLLLASGFSAAGYDSGGNALQATAYLARWAGPVSAAAEPYPDGLVAGLKPLKHVQQVLFLPPRKESLANAAIKWAITTHGALETAMYLDPSIAMAGSALYDAATASYYCSIAHNANHAVDIIGWDNAYPASDFATQPPGNGAFLVRNNWGTSWGQGGYFWVSYYDASIGHSENALFCDAEPTSNYRAIYQYDPLGWTEEAAIGYTADTAWFANRFKARVAQHLQAVSFYSSASRSRYRVYANLGGPSARRLVASGKFAWPGYHTVRLSRQLSLVAGQFFCVAVKLTTPSSLYPIPLEERIAGYSAAAAAAPGQSYVSSDGITWTDLTTIAGQQESNVCLKAFAS
jgi:RNA polymerase sigma factor (sigma-70 family)